MIEDVESLSVPFDQIAMGDINVFHEPKSNKDHANPNPPEMIKSQSHGLKHPRPKP